MHILVGPKRYHNLYIPRESPEDVGMALGAIGRSMELARDIWNGATPNFMLWFIAWWRRAILAFLGQEVCGKRRVMMKCYRGGN
jgi:hypothetical protein